MKWKILTDFLLSEQCWLFLHCTGLIGVFYSRGLTTVSLVLIAIIGLLSQDYGRFRNFLKDRIFFPSLLIFTIPCLSVIYSEDTEASLTSIRIYLPFLILPIAHYLKGGVTKDFILRLHLWIILITVVVGFPVCAYAIKHYDEMLALLSKGQPIPVPIEHVKYSMFNAYGILSGIVLLMYAPKFLTGLMRTCILFSTGFLVLLIHLLAVRTGLIIFYASLLCLMVLTFVKYRSREKGLIFLAILILLPIITYKTLPSVQHKLGYVLYDWDQFRQGKGVTYSDSERLMLYRSGYEVWKKDWIFGVGMGDIRTEVAQDFSSRYQTGSGNKLPHNQFLLYLCGSGIIGLILFFYGFYGPLFRTINLQLPGILISLLYLNYSLSFIVENSLERSMSIAYFLLVALPLLSHLKFKNEH